MNLLKIQNHSNSVPPTQTFDEVHTEQNPYCSDRTCSCHVSVSYHDEVQHPARRHTDEQVELAFSFFGLGRRGGH